MYSITGPTKLHGSVKIQGAKNSSMKFPPLCLLGSSNFTFRNVPNISSIKNLLDIAVLQGAKVDWLDNNSFHIDTTTVTGDKRIDADSFYHTSGAIFYISVLASKFGKAVVEKHAIRSDTGGDAIGTRSFDILRKSFEKFGLTSTENDYEYIFTLSSTKPFVIDVSNISFSVCVNAMVAGMFKNGTSIIHNRSHEAELDDIIRFLQTAGAKVKVVGEDIYVDGPCSIDGIEFRTMSDKNDFATWTLATVATRSKITLTNVQPSLMNLDPLF